MLKSHLKGLFHLGRTSVRRWLTSAKRRQAEKSLKETLKTLYPVKRSDLPTIYILTAYHFNHLQRRHWIDRQFLNSAANFVFYFFDPKGKPPGFPRPALCERDICPEIQEFGKQHLAEWTFLLTEYKMGFARYPWAMISSRFYEKNERLGNLEWYLPLFAGLLEKYGIGYLPSYDRSFSMIDIKEYHQKQFLHTRQEGFGLLRRLYGVSIPEEYRYFADFWCNYIAFRDRAELKKYVEFYLPLIGYFFNERYEPIRSYESFVNRLNSSKSFREEKPLTLLLELASHLFFYVHRRPYFGLHYDGLYEVHEHEARFNRLTKLPGLPPSADYHSFSELPFVLGLSNRAW